MFINRTTALILYLIISCGLEASMPQEATVSQLSKEFPDLAKIRFKRVPELRLANAGFFDVWSGYENKFKTYEAKPKTVAALKAIIRDLKAIIQPGHPEINEINSQLLIFVKRMILGKFSQMELRDITRDIINDIEAFFSKMQSLPTASAAMPIMIGAEPKAAAAAMPKIVSAEPKAAAAAAATPKIISAAQAPAGREEPIILPTFARKYPELAKLRFDRIDELRASNISFFDAWDEYLKREYSKEEALNVLFLNIQDVISNKRRPYKLDKAVKEFLVFVTSQKDQISADELERVQTNVQDVIDGLLNDEINENDFKLLFALRIDNKLFGPDLKRLLLRSAEEEKIIDLILSNLKKIADFEKIQKGQVTVRNQKPTWKDLYELSKEFITLVRRLAPWLSLQEAQKKQIYEQALQIGQLAKFFL